VKIKYLFYLTFSFLIFPFVEAQVNPVYKVMIERGWIPFPNDDKIELTPEQMDKRFITSMGYNDSVVSALQKIGVDFSKFHSQSWWWNEKNLTAISDCIVIGTVMRNEYPMEKDAFFSTVAYVQVEEYLRNDYKIPISQIPVMIVSGPISSELRRIQEGEDTLKIGENVLLFLSANEIIYESNVNNQHKLYDQLINDPVIRFGVRGKYNVEDEKVIERNSVKNLVDIRKEINTVMKAIHNN